MGHIGSRPELCRVCACVFWFVGLFVCCLVFLGFFFRGTEKLKKGTYCTLAHIFGVMPEGVGVEVSKDVTELIPSRPPGVKAHLSLCWKHG